MKKFLLCLAFAVFVAIGANAYAAAVYNDLNDTVSAAGETGVSMVVITNTESGMNENNVFYIDQASPESVLDASLGFAMKNDAPAGTYYMTLKRNDGTKETIPFSVENKIKSSDFSMVELAASEPVNGKYSAAFITSDSIATDGYNTVKFGFTKDGETTYLGYSLSSLLSSQISIGETQRAFVGIQLNDIPSEYLGNVSMWLSNDTLAEKGGDSQ